MIDNILIPFKNRFNHCGFDKHEEIKIKKNPKQMRKEGEKEKESILSYSRGP